MARADELGDDSGADEAGCAGDEYMHENLLVVGLDEVARQAGGAENSVTNRSGKTPWTASPLPSRSAIRPPRLAKPNEITIESSSRASAPPTPLASVTLLQERS